MVRSQRDKKQGLLSMIVPTTMGVGWEEWYSRVHTFPNPAL
jgi:hypothetical protein